MKNRINIGFEHYLSRAEQDKCTFQNHLAYKKIFPCLLEYLFNAHFAF